MDILWREINEEKNGRKMRLFVGIELPKKIKDDLFRVQKTIPNDIVKVNWVAKKNLHITLKFIGEVDESKLEDIVLRLKKINFKKFDLSFNELGFYLYRQEPKVIRLGFGDDFQLKGLQKSIDEELLDMVSSDQKFTAHLTLGRIKLVKKKDKFFDKIGEFEFPREPFSVDSFCLIRSSLTKDGPKYECIETFKS